ncbi:MAG: hypothetical protein AB8G11_02065 [Saprospiraceae bacterium]
MRRTKATTVIAAKRRYDVVAKRWAQAMKNINKINKMFSENYPNIDWWINTQGWIELGTDNNSDSWVRILDTGGMYWEDETSDSLDDALRAADKWLSYEIDDRFGEEPPRKYDKKQK